MVVVRMKVGEDRRFDETYNERVRVKYEGVFAVITDKDGVRYSFPAVDIAEIKQDAGSRSW